MSGPCGVHATSASDRGPLACAGLRRALGPARARLWQLHGVPGLALRRAPARLPECAHRGISARWLGSSDVWLWPDSNLRQRQNRQHMNARLELYNIEYPIEKWGLNVTVYQGCRGSSLERAAGRGPRFAPGDAPPREERPLGLALERNARGLLHALRALVAADCSHAVQNRDALSWKPLRSAEKGVPVLLILKSLC